MKVYFISNLMRVSINLHVFLDHLKGYTLYFLRDFFIASICLSQCEFSNLPLELITDRKHF
jgi:hypothetical protein